MVSMTGQPTRGPTPGRFGSKSPERLLRVAQKLVPHLPQRQGHRNESTETETSGQASLVSLFSMMLLRQPRISTDLRSDERGFKSLEGSPDAEEEGGQPGPSTRLYRRAGRTDYHMVTRMRRTRESNGGKSSR